MFDEDRGYVIIEPYPTANELKVYYEGSYFVEGDLVKHDYLNDELIYRVTYLDYIKTIFSFIAVKKNLEILEYGCGVGSFVRSLLVSDEGHRIGKIDGVDISDTAVTLAAKHTKSLEPVSTPLINLTFRKDMILLRCLRLLNTFLTFKMS